MSLPPMIGLTGYAYVGKDTLAELLVTHHDYRRVAFADPLYAMLLAINPPLVADSVSEVLSGNDARPIRVVELYELYGRSWTKAKKDPFYGPELRDQLQRLGTDAARKHLGEDVWLRAAQRRLDQLDHPRIVMSDVRFPNEAVWVKQHEGVVVRIIRPGYGPVNQHVSDAGQESIKVDHTIGNGAIPIMMLEALESRFA